MVTVMPGRWLESLHSPRRARTLYPKRVSERPCARVPAPVHLATDCPIVAPAARPARARAALSFRGAGGSRSISGTARVRGAIPGGSGQWTRQGFRDREREAPPQTCPCPRDLVLWRCLVLEDNQLAQIADLAPGPWLSDPSPWLSDPRDLLPLHPPARPRPAPRLPALVLASGSSSSTRTISSSSSTLPRALPLRLTFSASCLPVVPVPKRHPRRKSSRS